jgi:hypothetical protein
MDYLAPLLRYVTLLAVVVAIIFGVATVIHGRRFRYLTVAATMCSRSRPKRSRMRWSASSSYRRGPTLTSC